MGKAKAKKSASSEQKKRQLKIVLSDTCEACRTPCARGIDYRERMREPGAVGRGVPCVLTRTAG